MEDNYIAPSRALKKLKVARTLPQTVYLYGATGYGKTELVRRYLKKCTYFSCEELPWDMGSLPPEDPQRRSRLAVVIDDLHRLGSDELRERAVELAQRRDVWLILISRSPIPSWLLPRYVEDGFIVISENDLRLGREEIVGCLEAFGIDYTEEDVQYLGLV